MADFPAMPLWTDAYIADTSHLSDAEHGRYLLMLQHMWRSPHRRFPNDDEWLARKFNRSVEAVREQLRPLLVEFFKTDGNWLFHKRIEREWAHVSASRAKQSARSKSRWEKEKPSSRGNAALALPPHHIESLTDIVESDSTKEERKKENSRETELQPQPKPPAPETPKAKPPRAAPSRKEYPGDFERLWATYPKRGEDGKIDCFSLWRTASKTADAGAMIEAAKRWRSVHEHNDYRIGLRSWLKNQRYLHDPPTYQPNGYGNGSGHDAFAKAAASLMRDDPPPPDDEADYGEYLELEGTCDRLPD